MKTLTPFITFFLVACTAIAQKGQTDTLNAPPPVLPGLFADPHIAVLNNKFYIYPTTDGTVGWMSTYFTCWSSPDLVNWKNEGTILDLPKDLTWAKARAWAPAIAEKDGKYYFYYSADVNIGVAVSDKPTGPFKDPLGKPLVSKGRRRGQMIDPMVFVDDDGSAYLYFGQGQCNVVKLNEDMISYDSTKMISFKPEGYNEGSFVFKRNEKYYLMWSEYDTRDPRYSVAYATADAPMGPFIKATSNPVLKGTGVVKGAGHHSVVKVPGKDEWYIVYHRFKIPDGNGYNRETCISPMRFDKEGNILPVDVFERVNNLWTQQKRVANQPLFHINNPDYKLSPQTGMTRQHWKDAALYLLQGAFSYIDKLDDPMQFPKQAGKSYPRNSGQVPTEKLEGLCRTLFIAAPLLKENPNLVINNIKVADYYRYQIAKLVDPSSETFIKHRDKNGGPSQILVEFGALGLSLFAVPEVIWDPLPQAQKDALAATMLSYGNGPTVGSNWKFFNIFVLSFFKEKGYTVNEKLLVEYLDKSLQHYRGEGWYNDAPAYDYYSMWAFQMYGPLWSEFFGKKHYPEYAKKFLSNFKDLKENYPYLFSRNGEMIMWGRSITYRIGSIIPFPLMGFEKDPSINYGWLRRISSGVLLQFLRNPGLMEDNIPTLGFYGAYEPAVQPYSCRGSVFWMGKAFLGLLVPEDSPFWTARENEGAWDKELLKGKVYNKFQKGSNILITDYPNIGASEVRSWCHVAAIGAREPFRSSENYNRLSYNSAFPWQADSVEGVVSMNYIFKNKSNQWEPLRLFTFKKYEDGIYYRDAVLETNKNISLSLADIPLANGILRIDQNKSSDSIQLRLGHYALPQLKGPIRQENRKVKGFEVQIIDNGVYQLAMIPVKGWGAMKTIFTQDVHPVSEKSAVINVSDNFSPGGKQPIIYATLMLWKKSGEQWTNEELVPLKGIEYSGKEVSITFKKGEKKIVTFE